MHLKVVRPATLHHRDDDCNFGASRHPPQTPPCLTSHNCFTTRPLILNCRLGCKSPLESTSILEVLHYPSLSNSFVWIQIPTSSSFSSVQYACLVTTPTCRPGIHMSTHTSGRLPIVLLHVCDPTVVVWIMMCKLFIRNYLLPDIENDPELREFLVGFGGWVVECERKGCKRTCANARLCFILYSCIYNIIYTYIQAAVTKKNCNYIIQLRMTEYFIHCLHFSLNSF